MCRKNGRGSQSHPRGLEMGVSLTVCCHITQCIIDPLYLPTIQRGGRKSGRRKGGRRPVKRGREKDSHSIINTRQPPVVAKKPLQALPTLSSEDVCTILFYDYVVCVQICIMYH